MLDLQSICQRCNGLFTYKSSGKLKQFCYHCPKPRKTPIPELKKMADAAISKYIRAKYPICQICGKKSQVAYHVISREHLNTRWDLHNILATCSPCNYGEKYHPAKYIGIFIRKFGVEKFLALEELSRVKFKPGRAFLEGIIEKPDCML